MLQTKKFSVFILFTIFLSVLGLSRISKAEPVTIDIPDALKGLKVSTEAYIDYSNGQTGQPGNKETSYNKFALTRGYLTVEKEALPWLGARVTMDIYQDSKSTSDSGSFQERMKYYYAVVKPGDSGFLTNMKSEIGQGHTPWLDFEEHINPYRCQGTMAIERAGVFASADTGVSLQGNFGGQLENAKETVGNTHYDGKYGSWHIGVYNGSGYHATEDNNNKVVEYRLTVRPVAEVLPGLQLSYNGLVGEGNAKSTVNNEYPDYVVNQGMLSFQNPIVILTGQYFMTKGNASGSWVNPATGDALKTAGYSFFANVRLPIPAIENKLSVFGRFDHFNIDDDDKIADDGAYDLYIGGLAYDVYKGNLVLVSYEGTSYDKNAGGKGKAPVAGNNLGDDQKVQVVWQIKL